MKYFFPSPSFLTLMYSVTRTVLSLLVPVPERPLPTHNPARVSLRTSSRHPILHFLVHSCAASYMVWPLYYLRCVPCEAHIAIMMGRMVCFQTNDDSRWIIDSSWACNHLVLPLSVKMACALQSSSISCLVVLNQLLIFALLYEIYKCLAMYRSPLWMVRFWQWYE